MHQNASRDALTFEEIDEQLVKIMERIHQTYYQTAEEYGTPENYINGQI